MYDSRCADLAGYFLRDSKMADSNENRNHLAQAIQDAIEDWFDAREGEAAFDKWMASRTGAKP